MTTAPARLRTRRQRTSVQRVLLSRREAADALGMSLSHFQRHVQPHIRCVYSGQLRFFLLRDIERWAEREAFHAGQRV